jgi:hypothetical protein
VVGAFGHRTSQRFGIRNQPATKDKPSSLDALGKDLEVTLHAVSGYPTSSE